MKSLRVLKSLQIVSIVLLLLCFCVILPVFLSLDIYGLQDAEFTSELYQQYMLKFWWYEGNGFAFLLLVVNGLVLSFLKIKDDEDIVKFRRQSLLNFLLSLFFALSYLLGSIIIDLVKSLDILEYWPYLIPLLLFAVIQTISYVVFHNISKQKELESIKEGTI
jgi:hypothetical protein